MVKFYWTKQKSDRARLDFETRSRVDLKKSGGGVYARDPSTQVLCLGFALPGDSRARTWYPDEVAEEAGVPSCGDQGLRELLAHISSGGLLEAFNAGFDSDIWNHVAARSLGFPRVPVEQWRCAASEGLIWGYPARLALAAKLRGVKAKMPEGKGLIKLLSRPQKSGVFCLPRREFEQLLEYCRGDVEALVEYSNSLPPLSEFEQAVFLADQRANALGLPIDTALCVEALHKFRTWKNALNAELEELTGVERGTQRQRVKEWLAERGLDIPDTSEATVDRVLAQDDLPAGTRTPLEIMKFVNRTSTAKYQALLRYAGEESLDDSTGTGRARRSLVYAGTKTARWAGRGPQPHNLPRGDIDDMDEACADILTQTTQSLVSKYGDLGKFLSGTVRGAIRASRGDELHVADFSAIEARVLMWLAKDEGGLDVFRKYDRKEGPDMYCTMAAEIYRYPVTKKDNPEERQLGKQAILGLGYGMGDLTFLLTLNRYGIKLTLEQAATVIGAHRLKSKMRSVRERLVPESDDPQVQRRSRKLRATLASARIPLKYAVFALAICRHVVAVYRSSRACVKQFWVDLESAAIAAVRAGPKGPWRPSGRVSWRVSPVDGALVCKLPSGRPLRYLKPSIIKGTTPWGAPQDKLTYVNFLGSTSRTDEAYGGMLAENVTQATARDLIAAAMVRADQHPILRPLMTVHDELVCEAPEGTVSSAEFGALVCESPAWAKSCPIASDAHTMKRYRK